ncbi:BREX-1 system adenine-specific DNA-methyltransferase PglX [Bacteroides propionicifaciens]|uniref:BREX-1 system adenine-specific DNA-methyltransferase PglX n=1 Tax=Bacteroides propionicifaciens TaxID=392838 RepID=UPI0034E1B719
MLPNNILAEGGFLDMLNHTEFITDDDFRSPELIGWLYQFYISERKDEVFAKKGKFSADEIPAATQIFTPNWIVKYMVENSVGRIYLDNNPHATAMKERWKYLVDPDTPTPKESKYRYNELTELRIADLACGSGHILNECFDILYDLYIAEGYTRGEAIENIFRHNLTGIDLDKRAQQLAIFALLLKACQKDRSYVDAKLLPVVLTMPKPWSEAKNGSLSTALSHFFNGCETPTIVEELQTAFELMKDADSLGSIMKFDIADTTRYALKQAVEYWANERFVPEEVEEMLPNIQLILALTERYAAIVMNPPYMGGGNMNEVLGKYVKKNYEEGKADLFSVFMYLGMERLEKNGKQAQINMQSWMFLSSFEKLRHTFLTNYHLDNMLHLGPRTFDELSGEVVQNTAFVFTKDMPQEQGGTYHRLIDGKSCRAKEEMFLAGENCYTKVSQQNFNKIPGSPIGYWVSSSFCETLKKKTLGDVAHPRRTIQCGDVVKYIHFWHEVSNSCIEKTINLEKLKQSSFTWFRFTSGGNARRWYGNIDSVLFWRNNGYTIKTTGKAIIPNEDLYFRKCVGYNRITSNGITARYIQQGILVGDATSIIVPKTQNNYYLGLLNSKVSTYSMAVYNPTLAAQTGSLSKIPILFDNVGNIENIVDISISFSRLDWDAHETSWDFQTNELIALSQEGLGNIQASINDEPAMNYYSLELLYQEYKTKWTTMFHQLHANEEELNRQFIDIYGLQDELTPDVPLEEITILQQGEVKIVDGALQFQADVVIKQLISYAIGCWMGRYRLDKPGLYIAHPNAKEEEIVTYPYGDEKLTIDDDGIIPVLPYECPFEDNLQNRIVDFVRIAFGNDSLAENLNFVEQCLGSTIEKYLDKEYWKNHKKMYQNRPIYWLWSSKKGAFKVISYMHRMDAYTAERVRSKYLLPYIEYLNNKIADLESRAAQLSVGESRKLDALRKAHTECVEYHERLQVVAEQAIAFDLDDGVVVNYAKFGDVLAKIK